MSAEQIDHPPHYAGNGKVECIDAIESMLVDSPLSPFQAALAFAVVKYLWRLGRKGDAVTDAGKARWYLDRLVKSLEEKR